MNHDVTAAVDVRNASRATGVTTDGVAAPDAIVQLGTALDEFATRVARRSRLDTLLTAAWERHTRDRALYTAKAHGRNQCVMATASALADAPVVASSIATAAARVERR